MVAGVEYLPHLPPESAQISNQAQDGEQTDSSEERRLGLLRLAHARLSLRMMSELAADWRAAQQLHEEVFREVSEMPEEGQVDEASQNSGEQAVSSYGEELESVRSAAEALLERLRSAVLRAPTSSVEVFRELASESGGRLNSSMLARLLSKFEPSVPVAVVDAAFGRLDQEGKGYVEENDWLLGLNLPRLGATDPRRT
eukprot:CAMPEP_0206519922 /NCGR_PEP_ID=MMETSP0324_2-20121206/65474_1 /ASSEMBLY_ACC=CAM_ASM_000836 /TAXON_ID=2866 /ORGANISM="Crypthecodinium cohnii, Strain Seligo" /LENGTH=198 /DNA_ID=CAMNT_0054013585 /DNA_START=94 /DNA_END=692 /DNA_ORIENTATION=-